MDMATDTRKWTAEMVRALPDDGNRYEVIDGELFVTSAPEILTEQIVWQPDAAQAPLEMDVPAYFAEVCGE